MSSTAHCAEFCICFDPEIVWVQRNWSRVARISTQDQSNRLFAKRFVTRGGTELPNLFRSELEGARLASRVVGASQLQISTPVACCLQHSTAYYKYVEMLVPDEAIRTHRLDLSTMTTILHAIRHASLRLDQVPSAYHDLPSKKRPFGEIGRAICFKGWDFRNFGLDESDTVHFFDVGAPYVAPYEEPAAKIIVTVGLLNWGWPLPRFLSGPPRRHLRQAISILGRHTSAAAVSWELERDVQSRLRDPQAATWLGQLSKRVTLQIIARRYAAGMVSEIEVAEEEGLLK